MVGVPREHGALHVTVESPLGTGICAIQVSCHSKN